MEKKEEEEQISWYSVCPAVCSQTKGCIVNWTYMSNNDTNGQMVVPVNWQRLVTLEDYNHNDPHHNPHHASSSA